jgi:hypothetical protein
MPSHSRLSTLFLALLAPPFLVACPADGADSASPSDSEATEDSGPMDSVPLDSAEDTGTSGPTFDDLQWSIHEDYGSIVVVSWQQAREAEVQLRYRVGEEDWLVSPARTREAGPQQELLLGLPYDSDASFILVAGDEESVLVEVLTDAAPAELPAPSLLASEDASWDPSMAFVVGTVSENRAWTIILDRAARPVWAHQTDRFFTSLYSHPSADGEHLLIDFNSFWGQFDGGAASTVLRMKIDGSEQEVVGTPGLHHPFRELPDGSLVWGDANDGSETLEQIDPHGVQSTLWSCDDWQQQTGQGGYCQSNTLYWHEPSGSFLYSFYTNDSIIEVERDSGQILRSFGQAPGSWAFSEGSAPFWWQHGATYTADGTLLTSSHRSNSNEELVVREYALNEGDRELEEIWSFGEGEGIRASEMGDAWRLPNGNTLHNMGSAVRMREITPAGEVVWDVKWDSRGELGLTTPLDLEALYALAPTQGS